LKKKKRRTCPTQVDFERKQGKKGPRALWWRPAEQFSLRFKSLLWPEVRKSAATYRGKKKMHQEGLSVKRDG